MDNLSIQSTSRSTDKLIDKATKSFGLREISFREVLAKNKSSLASLLYIHIVVIDTYSIVVPHWLRSSGFQQTNPRNDFQSTLIRNSIVRRILNCDESDH